MEDNTISVLANLERLWQLSHQVAEQIPPKYKLEFSIPLADATLLKRYFYSLFNPVPFIVDDMKDGEVFHYKGMKCIARA